ncbi:MAG: hypothetical protein HY744_13870 [Deltaproteobacteria bacterium]|nr:hypothetical protein [Deltaproteobacteria bacterium]
MSEKQIREAIDRVCADLDLRARQRAMRRGVRGGWLPLVLRAGLDVAACGGDIVPLYGVVEYGAPFDGGTAGAGGAGGTGGTGAGLPVGGGGTGGEDGGPVPPYMAPDGGEGGEGGEDAGPVPPYNAPPPDGG